MTSNKSSDPNHVQLRMTLYYHFLTIKYLSTQYGKFVVITFNYVNNIVCIYLWHTCSSQCVPLSMKILFK